MIEQPAAAADPERLHARAAGLVYVSDSQPGITRRLVAGGFEYTYADGARITDDEVVERIRKLAVPPAWRDVWICTKPNGHIQATGRDERGRKQYRYHAGWRDVRDRDKFERILDFARMLKRIRARVVQDMAEKTNSRERVLATIVDLLDKTSIRVGNDKYAKANGSFGLTTLRNKHLTISGNELRFNFKGKSGKVWRLTVKDRRIARIVRSVQDLPGQQLFQYVDDAGAICSVDSTDVNDYLREISGGDVSAKDFRTWTGTVLAVLALTAVGPFQNKTGAKTNIKRAIEAVAGRLGNTVTICRKCYIHPQVITCYLDGSLPRCEPAADMTDETFIPLAEAVVLRFLKRRLATAGATALEKPPKRSRATLAATRDAVGELAAQAGAVTRAAGVKTAKAKVAG